MAGPDRFVWAVFDLMQSAWWNLQDALRNLSLAAFDLVRALAIGLYFVSVALGVMVIRRGGRGRRRADCADRGVLRPDMALRRHGFGAHTRWMVGPAAGGVRAPSA